MDLVKIHGNVGIAVSKDHCHQLTMGYRDCVSLASQKQEEKLRQTEGGPAAGPSEEFAKEWQTARAAGSLRFESRRPTQL
jgi:hypothetical protein